ncbi:MAG: hypothetical protein NWF04_04195 [Candidatus Bathyarchaeota archaeon]|nr:hypothetical protein [Candidatus Bathyarchaeota archaeon]
MRLDEAKTTAKTLTELRQSRMETVRAMGSIKETAQNMRATKKLWRENQESKLIKVGLTLMVFPEPTPVSQCIGVCCLAAGGTQKAVQSRYAFMEDIGKSLKGSLGDILAAKQGLRL